MNKNSDHKHFDTLAVRSGQNRGPEGEHNDPIFMTSSFVFDSAEQAAARFAGTEPGNVYSRFTNPTVRSFETRLANLENAKHCSASASGMSAILSLCLVALNAGDHIVASRSLFGATINLFNKILSRFNIETSYVPLDSIEAWGAAITPRTKLLFVESPSNPLGEVIDISQLATLAHDRGCRLVVDNVACTPALQRPLELGADIVVHSATKYLDGQGRAVGGAVLTNDDELGKEFFGFNRTAGPTMSPFNAWVFLKGLETLSLRMRAHSEQALALARWLEARPSVSRVYYPGLESHPGHEIAASQQSAFGGVLAFDVQGGKEAAWSVMNSTKMLSITANLGDAKTTITHPASTTHARISDDERSRMGLKDSLLRIAVGFEALDDIKADLDTGLTKLERETDATSVEQPTLRTHG
jgi:O-succinylhomoserine sulfhydrylase